VTSVPVIYPELEVEPKVVQARAIGVKNEQHAFYIEQIL
jgi:hypothetical protein